MKSFNIKGRPNNVSKKEDTAISQTHSRVGTDALTKNENPVPAGNQTPTVQPTAVLTEAPQVLWSTGLKVMGLCFTKGFASPCHNPINLLNTEQIQNTSFKKLF
jgi:hypothetical protein